ELLGVDIVVPDITYLAQNREKVRGIVLTHGHEDHIGALPWILNELKVPVFGTEFTLALVENKLEEHELLDDADIRAISRLIPPRRTIACLTCTRLLNTAKSRTCWRCCRIPPTLNAVAIHPVSVR